MKNKKGDVWISAVLYFGLGIAIISILLAAGLPVINKLKDKNIALQTKEGFHKIDENVREVIRGGPGTQRILSLEIKKGEFKIIDDKITWIYSSKVYLSEPSETSCELNGLNNDYIVNVANTCIPIKEGNINLATKKSGTQGTYDIGYVLDYSDLAHIDQSGIKTIGGVVDIAIRNDGIITDNTKCVAFTTVDASNIKQCVQISIIQAS